MGSGKSHWGHIWARHLGYTFFDLDMEIEKAFKMAVEEIFEKHGEEKFRELERYHLKRFENRKQVLLSCGGGTPCFFDNIQWMKQQGVIIYLKASPQYILDRVMDETSKRPLLKEVNTSELLFFIQKKLKEREPVYLKADHILEVEKLQNDSLDFLQKKASEPTNNKTNIENKLKKEKETKHKSGKLT
jgi:shikimate kinase